MQINETITKVEIFSLGRSPLPHTVKKVSDILVSSRDVTYQTFPWRE
jgi:hypothetical protein